MKRIGYIQIYSKKRHEAVKSRVIYGLKALIDPKDSVFKNVPGVNKEGVLL
jgi:hypothetical protein